MPDSPASRRQHNPDIIYETEHLAVRSWDAAIQYRNGIGTETTHWRVGTQGITHSTRWAAVWAMRRAAHDGQNPRRLQLQGSSSSFGHVSQPRRRKPWARMPHCK